MLFLLRLAEVTSKLTRYHDTDKGLTTMTKLFLKTCDTPLPKNKGKAFTDKYIDENGEEAGKSRENDCYFKVPFKFDVAEHDVTKPGWSLRKYDDELDLWNQSMYF